MAARLAGPCRRRKPERPTNGSIRCACWRSCRWAERESSIYRNFAEPSDGLEPPTPSLPSNGSRNRCNALQRFSLVFAAFGAARFASDCRRLQPRGSIKAPSSVGHFGYVARRTVLRASVRATHSVTCSTSSSSSRQMSRMTIRPSMPITRESAIASRRSSCASSYRSNGLSAA